MDELQLLSGLLASPEEESLALLEQMAPAFPWLEPAVEELRGMPLDRWQGEHTRLFINGIPKTVCPPFESAWRQKSMGGFAESELVELYRRAGLAADDAPPDYLGTMLECAAFLNLASGETQKALRDELWKKHLEVWVPEFGAILERESELGLYRVLGARLAGLF